MKSLCCGRWAPTCGPSIRDVVAWLDRLVSKRKNSRCRRRSENVCYCPRFGKRIQKCLSLRMGSAVESKYSRPQAAVRFTWPKLCSSHYLPQAIQTSSDCAQGSRKSVAERSPLTKRDYASFAGPDGNRWVLQESGYRK